MPGSLHSPHFRQVVVAKRMDRHLPIARHCSANSEKIFDGRSDFIAVDSLCKCHLIRKCINVSIVRLQFSQTLCLRRFILLWSNKNSFNKKVESYGLVVFEVDNH